MICENVYTHRRHSLCHYHYNGPHGFGDLQVQDARDDAPCELCAAPDWSKPTTELLAEIGLTHRASHHMDKREIVRDGQVMASVDVRGAARLIAEHYGVQPPEWCR